MGNPYSAPSLSGYNSSPPSDDDSQTSANAVTWAKHIDKIGDPLKTQIASMNTNISAAFGKIFGANISSISSNYPVTTSDQGKWFNTTNAITATLPAAADAGTGFCIAFRNADASNSLTIDGNSSETINGNTTVTVNPGNFAILSCNGSSWTELTSDLSTFTDITVDTIVGTTALYADPNNFPQLSNDTDTDHDILFSAGSKPDSTGKRMIINTALTKQIDAAWSAGDDAGGLDGTESVAGTPDADTWYYCYTILNSTSGVVDAIFSETAPSSGPTLPSGYTHYAFVGAVLTNGSANIIQFTQHGTAIVWDTPQSVLAANTTNTLISGGGDTLDALVPPVPVEANISVYLNDSDGSNWVTAQSPGTTLVDNIGCAIAQCPTAGSADTGYGSVITSNGNIVIGVTNTSGDTVTVYSHGWKYINL